MHFFPIILERGEIFAFMPLSVFHPLSRERKSTTVYDVALNDGCTDFIIVKKSIMMKIVL